MSVATPAFYVTGGTLRHDSACYVERRADREVFDGLAQGEFCYVLTARQMGKSSLMVRAANKLRLAGARVAVLDLTAIGQNVNAEQWYNSLLGRIGHQLDCEDELEGFWLKHPHLGPLQRWLDALREVVLKTPPAPAAGRPATGRVVLFVDEIDVVRSLPFATDDFFAAVRECYNRRAQEPVFSGLTFCLLGVATPADLIRDSRQTPFNIGRRVELSDFTPEEAAPLARGLGWPEPVAGTLLRRALYWTNGHPYLTQLLCQAVAQDASVSGPAGVDRLCETLFLSHRAQDRDDNLLFAREYLLRAQTERPGLLPFYAQVLRGEKVADDSRDPLVNILRLSGISSVAGGQLRVRNRIYYRVFDGNWVTASLPGGLKVEEQAAFRRGVSRGVLAGVLGGIAVSLIAWTIFRWMITDVPATASVKTTAGPAATAPRAKAKLLDRHTEATAAQLDLSAFYNLFGLPSGLTNSGWNDFGGVRFDARGYISLFTRSNFRQGPQHVGEIPVGQKARRIHLLHAATGDAVADGTVIGSYTIRYADGQSWGVPIVFGKDVRQIEELASKSMADPAPVWSLKYSRFEPNAQVDYVRRLYMSTYVNPFPGVPIRSLEINSALTYVAPLVIAITLEP